MQKKYKNIIYASLGGILEFYDFVLFVFFLGVFSKIFFPQNDFFWTQINSYIAFGAAYLARPFGAIVMAHFGDKYGRKNAFYLSIFLMVIPNLILAFLPTYEKIGLYSTFVLFLIRIFQGLAIGAEVSGSWVYISEFAKGRQIPFVLGFASATLTSGLLLASFTTLILDAYFSKDQIEQYAWRFPFILSGIFGIFVLFLRKKINETPEFLRLQVQKKLLKFPLQEALKTHKMSMFICFLMTIVLTSGVATLMILPMHFKELLHMNTKEALWMQNFGILAVVLGSFIQGVLASKWGSYKICTLFSILFMIFGIFFSFYNQQRYFFIVCFSQGIITFAPVFMTQIFKSELRFSGLSFAYNISYAILAFLTPFMIDFLYKKYLGFYFLFVGLCSLFCIFLLKKFFHKEL
ncbi:MFS transporter [Campylobacter estrildidarum]|uniref:MFS transporter n=1 Tax=Campylobacter estrildidarum TaxID=2510189 RepID=A0A4U7BKE9_9BACT|nr:MFS transporter [Campylobacter estrildidarum]TKX30715.1 MFS transporter [Campylobacter estrildidarum]